MKSTRMFALLFLLFSIVLSGCNLSNEKSAMAQKEYTVGVVLKSMDSEYWMSVQAGLEEAAQKYNINLLILSAEKETAVEEQQKMIFDLLQNKNLDALIIAPSDINKSLEYVNAAKEKKIPLFTIDEEIAGIPYIGSDNYQIGKLAAQKLISALEKNKNEKRIVIICGNEKQNAHIQRVDGFQEELKKHSDFLISKIIFADSNFLIAYQEMKKLKQKKMPIDGIFVTSAVMGLGCIQALDEIQETNSLYLVGVDRQDDFIMAVNQKKANVIISQNGYEVGDLAVTTVFKALTGNSIPGHTYISNEIITQQNAAMYLPKEQGGL